MQTTIRRRNFFIAFASVALLLAALWQLTPASMGEAHDAAPMIGGTGIGNQDGDPPQDPPQGAPTPPDSDPAPETDPEEDPSPPESAITRPVGYINLPLSFGPVLGHIPTYNIERRYIGASSAEDQQGGWRTIAEGVDTTPYVDDDVMFGQLYRYRITTVILSERSLPLRNVEQRAQIHEHLAGMAQSAGSISFRIQMDAFHPLARQYVTITRYPSSELTEGTGTVVVNQQQFSSRQVSHLVEQELEAGSIHYYEMQLFVQTTAGGPLTEVEYSIPAIAVRTGVGTPDQVKVPTVTARSDGQVLLDWTPEREDAETWAYEVFYRPVKPINNSAPTSLGTTLGTTMVVPSPSGTQHYEYTVAPINVAGRADTEVQGSVMYPELTQPICYNPYTRPNFDLVRAIFILPDVTGTEEDGLKHTFDLLAIDARGNVCAGFSPEDFYLERYITFKHVLDPEACKDNPTQSCTVINRPSVHPQVLHEVTSEYSESEILYDVEGQGWGLWKWHTIGFSDEKLELGKYEMAYRICDISGTVCSWWEAVKRHYVGVESVPFNAPAPDYKVPERTFNIEDGIITF